MTSGGTTDAAVKSSANEFAENARAKVNLTLRVVGRRVDGYHDLESVVAFADCADRLSLLPGAELSSRRPVRWQILRRGRRQPRAQGGAAVGRAGAWFEDRHLHAPQGLARCGRNRRRFGGRSSSVAAACARQWFGDQRCADQRGRAPDRRGRSGLSFATAAS